MSHGHGYHNHNHTDSDDDYDENGDGHDESEEYENEYNHDLNEEDQENWEEENSQDIDDENDEPDIEFEKLNDISKVSYQELQVVDMGKIHTLLPLQPYKKIFKSSTIDISSLSREDINLLMPRKIKILDLKNPIHDIKKVKKMTDICMKNPYDFSHKYLLDLTSLHLVCIEKGPYSDLIFPQQTFTKKLKNILSYIPKPTFDFSIYSSHKFHLPKIGFSYISQINWKTHHVIKKLNYYKTGIYFIFFMAILVIYGIGVQIQVKSTFSEIRNFHVSNNIQTLKTHFVSLKSDIILSRILLKPIFLMNHIFQNQNLSNVEYGLSGVAYVTNYGVNIITIIEGTQKLMIQKGPNSVLYSELYKNILPILSTAQQNINLGLDAFSHIQNIGNIDLEKQLDEKINLFKKISYFTNELVGDKENILSLLGDNQKRTYLIVFQNNDEIRPMGGFMGSVGLVQIFKGKIINFEKKDIYALEWNIKDTFHEPAPVGLASITDTFALRQENYYPSLQESSEKIKSFIDKTQYHIDGIIYVNQNIILDFLKKFGGMDFPEIQKTINADNFSMIVSTLVESKVTKTHVLATPKQVLFDFIDQYMTQLKKQANYGEYLNTLLQSIQKKDIMVYDFDPKINEIFGKIGFQNVPSFQKYFDFNYPVFTSISGNKSDRYMERSFVKNITYNKDCSINTDFKITQNHTFNSQEENNIKNFLFDMDLLGRVDLGGTLFTQGKGTNKQFVRLLIPKNAQVKPHNNIEIHDRPSYKEISFYMNTDVGLSSKFKISYTLPNPECKAYNYLFEKQSGLKEYQLRIQNNGNQVLDSYLSSDYIFGK